MVLQLKTTFLLFSLKRYCIPLWIRRGKQNKTKHNTTTLPNLFEDQTVRKNRFVFLNEQQKKKKKINYKSLPPPNQNHKKTLTHLLSDPPHLQGAVQCLH